MRIKKNVSKNSISYSVIESFRDKNGKSTTRVVESLGNEEEILKKHPGVDPEEWAKDYAKKLTDEKNKANTEVIAKYSPTKQIPLNQKRSYNVGYLFLQQIYYDLKLNKIAHSLQQDSKFTFDLNEILTRLLYMRILYPSSKKKSFEEATELLEPHTAELHHIYRALDVLAENSHTIQEKVYKNSTKVIERQTQVLYYDCTNYYFEIEEADGLKQYGMSKENRPNPIVSMGLFMDGNGLPLAFDLHRGNQNEQPTLKPIQKRIMKDFELSKMIVITDAGLSSTANRKFNNMGQRGFVTTQSIKKLPSFLKEWAISKDGWKLSAKDGYPHHKTYNLDELNPEDYFHRTFYKERWINENNLEQRLIVTFSFKYQNYQQKIREKHIERALKKIDKPSRLKKKRANDPNRFIQSIHHTEDGDIAENIHVTLNEDLIAKESQFDGIYGVCTNVTSSVEEIVQINHRRWEIEETFRILKGEMKSRPIYLSRDNRIEAHFLTCYLSVLILRILEKKLNEEFTASEIISQLKKMRVFEIPGAGYTPAYTRTELTDKLHETFGLRTDMEIIKNTNMKKIIKQTKNLK